MSTSTTAALRSYRKKVSENKNCAAGFVDELASGEEFTGQTPTVTASGLTIDNVAVSTGTLTIDGVSVPSGQAITWRVTGGTAATDYLMQIQCITDASPAQTIMLDCEIRVEAD